jgi:hypothetical protein
MDIQTVRQKQVDKAIYKTCKYAGVGVRVYVGVKVYIYICVCDVCVCMLQSLSYLLWCGLNELRDLYRQAEDRVHCPLPPLPHHANVANVLAERGG